MIDIMIDIMIDRMMDRIIDRFFMCSLLCFGLVWFGLVNLVNDPTNLELLRNFQIT